MRKVSHEFSRLRQKLTTIDRHNRRKRKKNNNRFLHLYLNCFHSAKIELSKRKTKPALILFSFVHSMLSFKFWFVRLLAHTASHPLNFHQFLFFFSSLVLFIPIHSIACFSSPFFTHSLSPSIHSFAYIRMFPSTNNITNSHKATQYCNMSHIIITIFGHEVLWKNMLLLGFCIFNDVGVCVLVFVYVDGMDIAV